MIFFYLGVETLHLIELLGPDWVMEERGREDEGEEELLPSSFFFVDCLVKK